MKKWNIDPDHSVAAFAVQHMTIANVRGQFNKINGSIYLEPDEISNASVNVEIDVSGITTGIKKRDEHLLSADFLDALRYPKIIFKSTSIEAVGDNSARVMGDLTIHGITHPVTFDIKHFGPVKSPFGGEITMGFSATLNINREDFGISWNEIMEGGGIVVGKNVQITIDVEADLAS